MTNDAACYHGIMGAICHRNRLGGSNLIMEGRVREGVFNPRDLIAA